ncbi:hypothetical protein D3C86_1827220 [compost metagenome]
MGASLRSSGPMARYPAEAWPRPMNFMRCSMSSPAMFEVLYATLLRRRGARPLIPLNPEGIAPLKRGVRRIP